MCLSLRLAPALVPLSIVFPLALGQDQKPGSHVSGSIAQPASGRNPGTGDDDKADTNKNEKKKVFDEASPANGLSDANPSLRDPLVRVLPAFGNLPANVADQLGFAERQGADSQRPALEGRFVAEFQLDRAQGVAPAELIVSFEHARRRAIVTAASVPAAFRAAFPNGVGVESNSDGLSAEIQLPTRFVRS